MRRREFITLIGAVAAWPLAAQAQQPAMPVIGFLGSTTQDLLANLLRAYRDGLRDAGYIEGNNVAIEFRWAESQYERLPSLAADLVARRVDVITAAGSPRRSQPRQRRQQFLLSFHWASIRSRSVSSPV